jgi:hypothetical protein
MILAISWQVVSWGWLLPAAYFAIAETYALHQDSRGTLSQTLRRLTTRKKWVAIVAWVAFAVWFPIHLWA